MDIQNQASSVRVDLVVPFSEKEQVKSLGAKRDPSKKVWYVPPGRDQGVFARWITGSVDGDSPFWLPLARRLSESPRVLLM